MPESERPDPPRSLDPEGFRPNPRAAYVELGLFTAFSFLRGASEAADLAETAAALGYDALGCADLNTLAGAVRFHVEAGKAQIRPLIGARLELVTGEVIIAYPRDREAYGRLARLLSKGKRHDVDGVWQAKGKCDLTLRDLADHAEGLELILVPPAELRGFDKQAMAIKRAVPTLGHIAAAWLYRGDDRARINRIETIARRAGLVMIATNEVLYHAPDRRPLQDVMTCIRLGLKLTEAGTALAPNAERHLKSPAEMARLFAEWPQAVRATRNLADRIGFGLEELRYEYPREVIPQGRSPQEYLSELTWAGAAQTYLDGVPTAVTATLKKELAMIEKLDIARYFLTIHDIIRFAREGVSPPILCQGRGSAANSAVCYVLGITAVDPAQHQLLFERFISEERKEPPDIDVDFEHERREEVIQHIYAKYGRDRAGLCATVIRYRPRSAIREVGKVMGLSEDVTGALARTVWGSWGREVDGAHVSQAGLDLNDPLLRRTVQLAHQIIGMPRHLGQHVGGFILTERLLSETVPIGNGAMPERSFIEWDKDDIDALGILKVDILALGMLTCIRKCIDLVAAHHGRAYTLATIPREDPRVYEMLSRGDSVGVFQVESRAQINMLPRLRPRCFYDLVIEVAIVRPGPIQGDMVHPYLRRRNGEEAIAFPSPAPPNDPEELKSILGRTLGVPIFQEQAMKIAIDAARFSPAEANELRKAMATFRSKGTIGTLEERMVGRMVARGYDPDFARRCFDQIKGFGEYGFPESHAASFAHLVYVSAWLRLHYPAAFAAALLNSQPMGFYAPAQIIRDARDHGVRILPPDVNYSEWDNTLEPRAGSGFALRLGLRQITGLPMAGAARLLLGRDGVPYTDIDDLTRRGGVTATFARRLAEADGLGSLFIERRQALWLAKGLHDAPDLPLFAGERDEGAEPTVPLPVMPQCEEVVADYQTLRLTLRAHPMTFLRRSLGEQGYLPLARLADVPNGARVRIAGVVLIRQRPGTAKGVCFVTLEDETGNANLVVWPKVMEAQRRQVMAARLMAIEGRIQREVDIIHVIVDQVTDRTDALVRLANAEPRQIAPQPPHHPRNLRLLPKSRDFH